MTAFWTCCRCEHPIDLEVDGEPHTDPETAEDCHDRCCASCHPHLATGYGIELDATTDDLRTAAEMRANHRTARHDDGTPMIGGHGGGMTQGQTARGEAAAAANRVERGAA